MGKYMTADEVLEQYHRIEAEHKARQKAAQAARPPVENPVPTRNTAATQQQPQTNTDNARLQNTYIPASLAQNVLASDGKTPSTGYASNTDARLAAIRGEDRNAEMGNLQQYTKEQTDRKEAAKKRDMSAGNFNALVSDTIRSQYNPSTPSADRYVQTYLDAKTEGRGYIPASIGAQLVENAQNAAEERQTLSPELQKYRDLSLMRDYASGVYAGKNYRSTPYTVDTFADLHAYINDTDGRRTLERQRNGAYRNGSIYDQLTEAEINNFNYLVGTQGKEAAEKYLEDMMPTLNARRAAILAESIEESERTAAGKVAGSINSVFLAPLVGAGYAGAAIDKITGKEIDPNASYLQFAAAQNKMRSEASKDMGTVGKFLYDAGMSVADVAAVAALTGGTGLTGKAAAAASGSIMGSGAATNTMTDALARGATEEQALAAGGLSGIAESLFESVSFGTLLNLVKRSGTTGLASALQRATGNVAGGLIEQMTVEASEEALTEVANYLVDYLIMGGASDYSQDVYAAMQRGMSREEAEAWARRNAAKQVGLSALSGALSGGVLGGTGAWAGAAAQRAQQNAEAAAREQQITPYAAQMSQEAQNQPVEAAAETEAQEPVAAEQTPQGRAVEKPQPQTSLQTETAVEGLQREENAQAIRKGEEGIRLGYATTIKNPYNGRKPTQKKAELRETEIPQTDLNEAGETIKKAEIAHEESKKTKERSKKTFLAEMYEELIGKAITKNVEVKGVEFNEKPYVVSVYKNVIKKLTSDQNMTAEKFSLLRSIGNVIENAEYIDSGDAAEKPNVIRYDYFESRVKIGGKRYIAKIDVEALNDKTNRLRTYLVKNIDLVPYDGPLPGSLPEGFQSKMQDLNYSMPRDTKKVNTPPEQTHQPQPLPMTEDTAQPLPSSETQQPQQARQPQPLPSVNETEEALTQETEEEQTAGEKTETQGNKPRNRTEKLRSLMRELEFSDYKPETVTTRQALAKIAKKDFMDWTAEDVLDIVAAIKPGAKSMHNADVSRVLDRAAGGNRELRQILFKVIEEPFNIAAGNQGKMQTKHLKELEARYKAAGVKPDSKEAAAVMKYGNKGLYLKDGEWMDYSLDDLRREFPKKWETLKTLAEQDREMYERYADEINEIRERIYPELMKRAEEELQQKEARVETLKAQRDSLVGVKQRLETELANREAELSGTKNKNTIAYANREGSIAAQKEKIKKVDRLIGRRETMLQDAEMKAYRLRKEIENGEPLHQRKLEKLPDYYHHVRVSPVEYRILSMMGRGDILGETVAGTMIDGPAEGTLGYWIDAKLAGMFGNKNISPSLVGTSEHTKPKVKWEGILEHQGSSAYKLDSIAAMADYIAVADYMIAFDEYTSQLRDVQSMIRSAATKLGTKSGSDFTNANDLIEWLGNWDNAILGKTNFLDRAVQTVVGRNIMNGIKRLNSTVRSATLLGNFRSAIVQGSAIANATNYMPNPADWARGITYTINAMGKNSADYAEAIGESDFLAQRNMESPTDIIATNAYQKAKKPLAKLLQIGQNAADQLTWWTAYAKYVNAEQNGKLDQLNRAYTREYTSATDFADDITRRSVGGRGTGEQPLTVKSTVVDMLAPFQTEVLNSYNTAKENVKALIGKDATPEQRKRAAAGIVAYQVTAFTINAITGAIFGDDILGFDYLSALKDSIEGFSDEDEENPGKNMGQKFLSATVGGVPFASALPMLLDEEHLTEIFGEEGTPSRYGTGAMGVNAAAEVANAFLLDPDADWWDRANAVAAFVPLGGKQLVRSAQGVATVAQGGSFKKDKDGKKQLQFRTDQKLGDYLQAGLFGKWALPEAKEYIDKGFPIMSAEMTDAYLKAKESGMDGAEFMRIRDEYKALTPTKDGEKTVESTTEKLRKLLYDNKRLTNEQKQLMDAALTGSDTPADYSTQERFDLFMRGGNSYEKFVENVNAGMSEEEAYAVENWRTDYKELETIENPDGTKTGPKQQLRDKLMADTALTPEQKQMIDEALFAEDVKEYTPPDYSNADSFAVSQMSESAQKAAQEYERLYDGDIGTFKKYYDLEAGLENDVDKWGEEISGSAREKFRQELFDDDTLTPREKAALDELITGSNQRSYTSDFAFELTSISEKAYERGRAYVAGGVSEEDAIAVEEWMKAHKNFKKAELGDYMEHTLGMTKEQRATVYKTRYSSK